MIKARYVWLEGAWKQFLRWHNQQHLPHAFLLAGAQGIGKLQLVHEFAQLALCRSPKLQGACEECVSCHLYQQGAHPDYYLLGDKEENIGIDEIRETTAFLSQTAHQKGRKVVVIEGLDKLSANAANALLKTLEEPPTEAVFFLVTSHVKNVLATLKSRCVQLTIPLPPRKVTLSWLAAQCPDKTKEERQWCLLLAGGAPLKAKTLLESVDFLSCINKFNQAMLGESTEGLYQAELRKFISEQPEEAHYLLYGWITEFIRYTLQPAEHLADNVLDCQQLKKLKEITLQETLTFLDSVNESIQSLTIPGINKQLLFESLFYRWQAIIKQKEMM